jgi:type II secretory pathway pseudopilin PulG
MARAELLLAAGLVVVFLAIAVPAVATARQQRRLWRVAVDLAVVVKAIDRYYNEYRTWPSLRMGDDKDTRYGAGRPNVEIMRVLRAEPGAGNPAHVLNPNRIAFLPLLLEEEGLDPNLGANGDYRDPWGTPYQVVLDTNADESCLAEGSGYGVQADQDLLVWSCGPDRESDTADDILAWHKRD